MKLILIMLLLPVLCVQAQSSLDKKVTDALQSLQCARPDERDPVKVAATLVQEADSCAVIIKAKLAPGWHIYQYVPPTLPYITYDYILQVPASLKAVGEWQKSDPVTSVNDPGVLMYEGEAFFVRKLAKAAGITAGEVIKAGLYYQTCNLRQCLPPVERVIELKVE